MNSSGFYRVKDWDRYFENNRTRELKVMRWIPVPNKHDGEGYNELVDHENGAAHLGAWLVILQVASKCGMRGSLLRDGGKPHDSKSIARITRIDRKIIDDALERLSSPEVGWLEYVDSKGNTENPQEGAGKSQEGASASQSSDYGREGNGREGKKDSCAKNSAPFAYTNEFLSFWEVYPNKKGKGAAFTSWKRIKNRPDTELLIKAVEIQKRSRDWTKDNGKFIPMPTTWLNQRRWEDGDVEAQMNSGKINDARKAEESRIIDEGMKRHKSLIEAFKRGEIDKQALIDGIDVECPDAAADYKAWRIHQKLIDHIWSWATEHE